MKDKLTDLIKKTMKDEISILQRSNIKKLEVIELKVKECSEDVSAFRPIA